MTMKRNAKTEVQNATRSLDAVRSVSPKQIAKFGKYLPLEEGRAYLVKMARDTRTHGRTRASVTEAKAAARRTAGRRRVF